MVWVQGWVCVCWMWVGDGQWNHPVHKEVTHAHSVNSNTPLFRAFQELLNKTATKKYSKFCERQEQIWTQKYLFRTKSVLKNTFPWAKTTASFEKHSSLTWLTPATEVSQFAVQNDVDGVSYFFSCCHVGFLFLLCFVLFFLFYGYSPQRKQQKQKKIRAKTKQIKRKEVKQTNKQRKKIEDQT